MDRNPEALAAVPGILLKTLSPEKAQREQAEGELNSLYSQQGYGLLLLRIIELHSSGPAEPDVSIRQAAAVNFKNLVKKRWNPGEEADEKDTPLSPEDKQAVKSVILELMCNVPPNVQKQLSEALTIISTHDFPEQWPTLLPEMVQKLGAGDYHVVNGVLLSANAILKRFRHVYRTDAVLLQLKLCLEQFADPLTKLFIAVCGHLQAAAQTNDQGRLGEVMEALRLICRLFYSLNWLDIPEYFEDNLTTWMDAFHTLLSFHHPLLEDESETDRAGPVERLQAAIVENVNMYASKYEEEFQVHLGKFTTAIWELLKASGTSASVPKYDAVTTISMRFLASLASKQVHFAMFNNDVLLREIIELVVVPNITMRGDEEEMFEDNPTEYIQRDMEGSDQDTRRRCSCDLVRALCQNFDDKVTAICSEYITNLMNLYAVNSNNWKPKDAAICLMFAVTIRAESAARGVSAMNERVNVMDFFTSHIVRELEDLNVNSRPIIRADCLKFVSTFRQQFSTDVLRALIPLLVSHLNANYTVLQTYAAYAIERLLNVRDRSPLTGETVRRLGRELLQPVLPSLFEGLFSVIDRSEGQENEYVMKCIMRLLTVVQADILPVVKVVLDKLTASLARVCKNPSNPLFNHYLFEALASLVNAVCRANPNATSDFETLLLPPFETVLSMDVAEFTPYVFQILAQLLLYRPNGMSPAFSRLFGPILSATVWERKSNVPGLVVLLNAYLTKAGSALAPQLEPILGIFQRLLSTRVHEKHAFDLLCTIFDTMEPAAVAKYQPKIFELVLIKLQMSKSSRTIRLFIHFMGFFAGKRGPGEMVQILESMQSGLTRTLLTSIWLPNSTMPAAAGGMEAKAVLVGMSRLLCEYADLQSDQDLWGGVLQAAVSIACPETGKAGPEPEDEEDEWDKQQRQTEVSGEAVYSKLHFASGGDHDWFPQIPDGPRFLVQELHSLLSAQPGRFQPAIQKSLSPTQLQSLSRLFESAGVRLQ